MYRSMRLGFHQDDILAVAVSAPGAGNSPQIVSVLLAVLPAGITAQSGGASRISSSMVRRERTRALGHRGREPRSQSLTFSSSATLADSSTIIQYVPQSGTLPAGGMAKITVQPDFSKQANAVNTSTLGIQFSDGSVQTVEILTVVGEGGGSSASFLDGRSKRRSSPSCGSQLNLAPSDSSMTITSSPGQAVTISLTATDGCGKTVSSGITVNATFTNGDTPKRAQSVGGGKWNTTYTPTGTAPSGAWINAFSASASASNVASPTLKLSVVLQSQASIASPPIVTDGGVANGASFTPRLSEVAPGSYISIFGQNLGDSSQPAATSVMIGTRALALTYVADTQINAQIPFDMPGVNNDLPIVVQRGGAASVPTPVSIAAADPAIFTVNQSGSGQGAIVNALARSGRRERSGHGRLSSTSTAPGWDRSTSASARVRYRPVLHWQTPSISPRC